MRGSSDNNVIYGGWGQDILFGDGGENQVYGGHNNDFLFSKINFYHAFGSVIPTAADTLYGGSGTDEFYIGPTGNVPVRIVDMEPGESIITSAYSDVNPGF